MGKYVIFVVNGENMTQGKTKDGNKRKSKSYIPGKSAYKRAWTSNHYKKAGLSLENYIILSSQNCYYCGQEPIRYNPYGLTYPKYAYKYISEHFWNDCWIYINGIDKKVPCSSYDDLSNLLPCCVMCNWMKGRFLYDEFIQKAKQIAEHIK